MYFYAKIGGEVYEEEINQYVIDHSVRIFYGGMQKQQR
jgi:hypothetical protein